jgi:hypothetical protein
MNKRAAVAIAVAILLWGIIVFVADQRCHITTGNYCGCHPASHLCR